MARNTKIGVRQLLSLLSIVFAVNAHTSPSASCTLTGNWQHKAAGSSQSCLSYVCCAKGEKTAWIAGTDQGAEDWCKSWNAAAVPDDSCDESTHEIFSKMTLIEMARLTHQAQEDKDEGDDDDEAAYQPPPPQIQCRYDRECDGE